MRCVECGGIIPVLCGVVCANFGFKRGVTSNACKNAWHASCFVQHVNDSFPSMNSKLEDEDLIDEDRMEVDDEMRFREARDGDHLMTNFQCDCCHF